MRKNAVRIAAIGAFAVALLGGETWAGLVTSLPITDVGVTTDLFDVRQGAINDSASLSEIGFVVEAAYGGSRPDGPEPENFVFANFPPGTVNTFTLKTFTPISLSSFKLVLDDNSAAPGNPGRRDASLARLFYSSDGTNFTLASTTAISPNYFGSYGSSRIGVIDSFAPVTAQFFRLDLTAASNLGPRVIELDGFGGPAAVPEPSTVVLIGSGAVVLLGCGWLRRKRAGIAANAA